MTAMTAPVAAPALDIANFITAMPKGQFFSLELEDDIKFYKRGEKSILPIEIVGAKKVTCFSGCRTGLETGNTIIWQEQTGKAPEEIGQVPKWAEWISEKFWRKKSDGSLLLRVNCTWGMQVKKFAIFANGELIPFSEFLSCYGDYVLESEKPKADAVQPAFMSMHISKIIKIVAGGKVWERQ